jgi:hypothetical protein
VSKRLSCPVPFFELCLFSKVLVYSVNGIQNWIDPKLEENRLCIVVVGALLVLLVIFIVWHCCMKAAK